MEYFPYLIIALAAVLLGFGIWLGMARRNARAQARAEGHGSLDVPVYAFVAVFALGLPVWAWVQYDPNLEKQNNRLLQQVVDANANAATADKTISRLRDDLNTADAKRRDAEEETADKQRQLDIERRARQFAETTVKDALIDIGKKSLPPDEVKQYDAIAAGLPQLNRELTVLEVIETPWLKLKGEKVLGAYEIFNKQFKTSGSPPRGYGVFNYRLKDFNVINDYGGKLTDEVKQQIAASICRAALTALAGKAPLSKAVQDALEEIPRIEGVELPEDFVPTSADLIYASQRLRMLSGKVRVLIRGFADGEEGPWRDPLKSGVHSVLVHRLADEDPRHGEFNMTFASSLTQKPLGATVNGSPTYGNVDLPDLRAEDFAGFVSGLVDGCPVPGVDNRAAETKIELLDGLIYNEKEPSDRKARLYVAALPSE